MSAVAVHLKQPNDYRTIQEIIARHGLRPVDEHRDAWLPGKARRITFIFEDEATAAQAAVALSGFLPSD